jgi:outer membrane protein OmpA-like peptidoglycan-associated protein
MAEVVKYYKGLLHAQFETGENRRVHQLLQLSDINLHGRFQLENPEEVTIEEYKKFTETPSHPFLQQTLHSSVELLHKNSPIKAAVLKEVTLLWSEAELKDGIPWVFLATKDKRNHGRIQSFSFCKVIEFVPDIDKPINTKPPVSTIDSPKPTQVDEGLLAKTPLNFSETQPILPSAPTQSLSGCSPLSLLNFGGNRGCRNIGCGLFVAIPLLFVLLGMLKQCQHENSQQGTTTTIVHDTVYVERVVERVDTLTLFKTDTIQLIDSTKETILKPVVLPNVQFYTNSSNLIPTSLSDIQQLAQHLIDTPNLEAIVIGHTDNVGNPNSNKILSQRRAETVRNVIISIGVEPERLQALGKGDTEPKADNSNEEGRLMNRRVEVQLIQRSIVESKTSIKK